MRTIAAALSLSLALFVAAASFAGDPDPSPSQLVPAALATAHQDGHAPWAVTPDAAAASSFLGFAETGQPAPVTTDRLTWTIDAAAQAAHTYRLTLLFEYRAKPRENVPPDSPVVALYDMDIGAPSTAAPLDAVVLLFHTPAGTWTPAAPIDVPGLFDAATLNAAGFGGSLRATMPSDAASRFDLRLIVRVEAVD